MLTYFEFGGLTHCDLLYFYRLAQELAAFGADCIVKTLADLPLHKKGAVVQDDATATKAPKLTFKDGIISPDESATDIFHVRMQHQTQDLLQGRLTSVALLFSGALAVAGTEQLGWHKHPIPRKGGKVD